MEKLAQVKWGREKFFDQQSLIRLLLRLAKKLKFFGEKLEKNIQLWLNAIP